MASIVKRLILLPKARFRPIGITLVMVFSLASPGCRSEAITNRANKNGLERESVPTFEYEIVHVYPHDPGAFTQGLIFHDGKLIESTGEVGRSSLRRVELETGKVLQQVEVPAPYFAEGITLLKGKIYQLTWQHQVGFIYDAWTFEKIGTFNYQGEGWGLTNDGQSLIFSDGTNRIRFLDPDNEVQDEEAVLNGIAYDETSGRLLVTGKLWPKLFEIRLIRK